MNRYLFEYRYDGAAYGFEVPAESHAEAVARVKAMAWARYEGEIALTVKVPGGGWLLRLWRWMMGAGGER